MSALRIWRKTEGKTQEQIAIKLGENPKTYSSYERGASPIPPEILIKLRAMGYNGPVDQHQPATPTLTQVDLEKALQEFEKRFIKLLEGKNFQETGGKDFFRKAAENPREYDSKGQKEKSVSGGDVPAMLPEHVQEAWIILSKAVDAAGADYRLMDRKALGLLVGLTAQEIAEKGTSESTQARLLARAEGFVHASLRHSAR